MCFFYSSFDVSKVIGTMCRYHFIASIKHFIVKNIVKVRAIIFIVTRQVTLVPFDVKYNGVQGRGS